MAGEKLGAKVTREKGGKGGTGKGDRDQPPRVCKECGETGRAPERCWALHPELKRVKKVQGMEGEEE